MEQVSPLPNGDMAILTRLTISRDV